jgi:subtilase family serine protease
VKGYRYQTGNFRIQVTAPRPDLVVSSVIANPAIVQAGGSTIISTSIRNNGDGPARDSEVSVTLNGESISAIRIGGLAAGRTAFFNFPLRNIQASPRVHSIAVTADSGNVIGESSEENNSRSATVTIAGKPDLVVEGLSARSDSTSQGIRWRIRFRVKNVGESEAGASLAGLYRSNRYVSGFEIGSLQPGESEAVEMEMIDSSAHVGWASRPSSDAPAQTQTDEGTSQASSEVSNSNTGDDGVVQIQHALLSAVSSPELRSVTFSATADESDQVNESNESNNIDEPIVVSAPRG